MPVELLLPGKRLPAPEPPSRIALDMAFGVGAGARLFDKSRYRSHGAGVPGAWVAGLHGYALDFDSTVPNYVEIPAAHTQLDFTTEDFSIIVRLNVEDLTVNGRVFNRGDRNADGYEWYIYNDGRTGFLTDQLFAWQITRSALGGILLFNWYTLGMSRTGNSVIIYINGLPSILDVGVHIDPAHCARSAKIGINDDLVSEMLDGRIEFLRVFGGVALQASEHLAWHNALA